MLLCQLVGIADLIMVAVEGEAAEEDEDQEGVFDDPSVLTVGR